MKEGATLGGSVLSGETFTLRAGKSRMVVRLTRGNSLQVGDVIVTKGVLVRDHKRSRPSLFKETVTTESVAELRRLGWVRILVG